MSIRSATAGLQATPGRGKRTGISLLAALLVASLAAQAVDSPIPAATADGTVTSEQIETSINAVLAREGLSDETRNAIVDRLRDAQAQIQNRLAAEAAVQSFAAALETAPVETQKLRRKLDEPSRPAPTAASLGIRSSTPIDQIETDLSRKSAEVASADAQLSELDSQISALEERPSQVRQRINELRSTRDQVVGQVEALSPPGEAPLLTDARRLAASLQLDARSAELNRLEQELASHAVRVDLARAQRDMAAREAARLRAELAVLQDLVNERRQLAAQQAQADAALAEVEAAGSHPVIREYAEGNAELTRELPAIVAETERATQELSQVESQARQIEQAYARSVQQLEIGGVSKVIGRLLAEERRNLPQVSRYHAELRARSKKLAEVGLAQIRIEEQRRDLTPIGPSVDSIMAGIETGTASAQELAQARAQVESLLRTRRDLLNQVAATYTSYVRALSDLHIAQQSLLDTVGGYKEFLDRHLLWIPSADFFGSKAIRNLGPALAWALSPTSWTDALRIALDTLRDEVGIAVAGLVLLLLIILARRPMAAWSREIATRIGDPSRDHIGLTLATLAIAAVSVLPLPLALAFGSWALREGVNLSGFGVALSVALVAVGPFLYNTLFFRRLCAPGGVLQLHFGWGAGRLPEIRKQLDRLTVIGVPVIFVAALTYNSPVYGYRESLGRLAFVIMMILMSGVVYPLLHPVKGVAARYYEHHAATWTSRLRWVWYTVIAGLPLVLAATSLVGYLYTSAMLTRQMIDTFWLLLGIGIVSLIIKRWLALARLRIAWQQVREREEQVEATAGEAGAEGELPTAERKPLDLDAVDQQTRRLVNAVLVLIGVLFGWGIWSDVLPALAILEQVGLWTQTVTVDGQVTQAPVTLADVLLGLVVAAVTAVAARNLPGLMEIAVLQRMTLLPGSRYAVNTLLRYVVVTIGVVVVLNIVGWDWSQIQWLVAALSVGLGFGLQEIVANFVSGLVILFERPVRVGDTVTVGELTGKVSRIRIRATTITDWDRKEIIVPNKAFITEQVVNWTLSDPITRLVIPVGIAYNSDAMRAHRIMEDTLRKMPLVLDEPEPKVFFVGFGDSSLNFNLYVFSRQLEDRLPVTHAVHDEILRALRENGIEIPFPQRDLHLRSVSPDIRGLGKEGETGD